jgi:hypothetical protein
VNQHEELNQPEELHLVDESFAEVEEHLAYALRPVAPPNGFADRIVARAVQISPSTRAKVVEMTGRRRLWTGWTIWTSGAIAAALLAGFFITGQTRARHQRQEVERAEHQFEVALRITDETLEQTRQQLHEAGVDLGN